MKQAELKETIPQLELSKAKLEALKTKDEKSFTETQQQELDNVSMLFEYAKSLVYKVSAGAEKLIHIRICKSRRFNSATGEELSKPFVQMFSFGEWTAFKNNFKLLGWRILEVLHDPFKEAEKYVEK